MTEPAPLTESTPLIEPPTTADELATLRGFLDFYRAIIRRKVEGLDREALAARLGPSDLTLGGLIKHLTLVEDGWLGQRLTGEPPMAPFDDAPWDDDPDWEFHSAADDEPSQLLAWYDQSVHSADRTLDRALTEGGLDLVVRARPKDEGPISLRWVLVHLIEEYARHAGHADLLREAVDGATGD